MSMREVSKVSLVLLFVAPAALAQPTAPPVAPAPAPQGDIAVRQPAVLSPQDMVRQSREYRSRIFDVVTRVTGMVDSTKLEKDVIRLNCLIDRQKQAQASLSIADQAIAALEDAIRRQDEGGALHEYTRVTIVQQQAQVLSSEADGCVGEDLRVVGKTTVSMEVAPGLTRGRTEPAREHADLMRPTQTASPIK
jgi:hypothetical protein